MSEMSEGKRLEEIVAECEAVMRKHGVFGAVTVASKSHNAIGIFVPDSSHVTLHDKDIVIIDEAVSGVADLEGEHSSFLALSETLGILSCSAHKIYRAFVAKCIKMRDCDIMIARDL